MPIPMGDFDQAPQTTEEEILRLLRREPRQAYSLREAVDTVSPPSPGEESSLKMLNGWIIYNYLQELVRQGTVQSRQVKGTSYYAAA